MLHLYAFAGVASPTYLDFTRTGVYNTHIAAREVIARLIGDGWYEARQSGAHKQFKHPAKPGRVTVAVHRGDIPIGTLKSIIRQAGWDWSQR